MAENEALPESTGPPDQDELLKDGIVFELCAESLQACQVARQGGAARIELCANLPVDGLTPDPTLIAAAVRESGLPVFALLRPRAGDFVYTDAEFLAMRQDLVAARALGVSGFALGVLLPNRRVDVARTKELVALAAPLDVTFHRAFDATPDLVIALEEIIATGCRRVLTSGGAVDVVAGADALAALVQQAAGRIEIAAGGGIRAENARALAEHTAARHFHGSLRHTGAATPGSTESSSPDSSDHSAVIDPISIHRVVEQLRSGAGQYHSAFNDRVVITHP